MNTSLQPRRPFGDSLFVAERVFPMDRSAIRMGAVLVNPAGRIKRVGRVEDFLPVAGSAGGRIVGMLTAKPA